MAAGNLKIIGKMSLFSSYISQEALNELKKLLAPIERALQLRDNQNLFWPAIEIYELDYMWLQQESIHYRSYRKSISHNCDIN